jgi:hypothetical protein
MNDRGLAEMRNARARRGVRLLGAVGAALVAGFSGCSVEGPPATPAGGGAGGEGGTSTVTWTTTTSTVITTSTSSATKLGASCADDDDCGEGLRCLTAAATSPVLGGGAPNGCCTKDCLDDGDCPGLGSRCLTAGADQPGECYLGCVLGPKLGSIDEPLSPDKCHGREDLRCAPAGGEPVCLPTCGTDAQCGARKCDPYLAACVDSPHTGKSTGALCDENAPDEDGCAGLCQTFTNDIASVCTSPCVLGGPLEGDDCGGLDVGVCVYRPSDYGAGDFGRCAPRCTVHDECGNPDWWCVSPVYSDNGYCFTTDDCPNGGSDCTAEDEDCIDTKYGPKCLQLDPICLGGGGGGCPVRFPLGTAAPSEGGGGAGGA